MRPLVADPDLAADYKSNKGYEAQRKFRAAWVSKTWTAMKRKKYEIAEVENSNMNLGAFAVVPEVLRAQGGDEMARDGIMPFLSKVVKLPMALRAKYVSVHPWTGRVELALPARTWMEKNSNRWVVSSNHVDHEGSGGGTATGSKGKGHGDKAAAAKAAPAKAAAKASDTVERIGGNKRAADEKADEAKEATPEKKKTPAHLWKEIKITKALLDAALQKSSMISRTADTEPGWGGLKRMDELSGMLGRMAAFGESCSYEPLVAQLADAQQDRDEEEVQHTCDRGGGQRAVPELAA